MSLRMTGGIGSWRLHFIIRNRPSGLLARSSATNLYNEHQVAGYSVNNGGSDDG